MKIKAYAKVNLTLDITGRRADGYHLIDSFMHSVALYDTVIIEKSPDISVACSVPQLSGEGNIAFRAARTFFDKVGISGGADIYIKKNIPYPAGLGGGSADAAAVIYGLNRLYSAGMSEDELCEAALSVGADVPFCIKGGAARVRGIGELIEKQQPILDLWLVIVNAGIKKSTGEMYRAIDNEKASEPSTETFISALSEVEAFDYCKNAFSFAYKAAPEWALLRERGALAVSISGSGPSLFGIFNNEASAEAAAHGLRSIGIDSAVAKAVEQGLELTDN